MKYLLISALLLSTQASASDQSEYQQWLQQTRSDFQSYLDENDKAFISFLQQKWTTVDVSPAEQRDPKPKPEQPPQAPKPAPKPAPQPEPQTKPPVSQPETPVVKIPDEVKPKPVTPPVADERPQVKPKPPVVSKPQGPVVNFDFYGYALSVPYDRKMKVGFNSRPDSKAIAAYWKKIASAPHQQTVDYLKRTAAELQLNDWGTAQLFGAFAANLQRGEASRSLMTWFLLVKAGYDARVAYNSRIFLLLTSDQQIFGVTFFRLDNKRYYAVQLNGQQLKPGKVYTYEGQHESGARPLDFSDPVRFAAKGKEEDRELQFSYQGKRYDINVAYPSRYVDYFSSYPQLSLPNYFKAGLPPVTAQSLLQQLKPVVQGQSETEAVNRLLRFVQTAFGYETDEDQFHEENYLFPLETLHYRNSDCEDRAALFAWLTESLLGLDVVILSYPGHVATAVAFHGKVQGDTWQFGGKSYVVADPTYINADIGMTIPRYAGVTPQIEAF